TIRVLNLVEPEKSNRYNPFVYLKNDDDVDRMVENFWKATTAQGAQKGEQIWDDTAKELLSALAYYLYYEAPKAEQNFPMI
ncbi:type IV secretory system conjugative DNA transfer family protein, partial [Streptomyces brasiliscabiei]|uniref:type IV secretory system conjugative DNA transfer family protein n=1 Tax=Streptomyces brasiliscabiei TaxID=2736302 RepID=UPI0030153BEB